MSNGKICSRCKKEKPTSGFYSYRRGPSPQCRECHIEAMRRYRIENQEILSARSKQAYKKNRAARIRCSVICESKRYSESPEFRCKKKLRARIRMDVKRAGAEKSPEAMTVCGCTRGQLKQHMESMFSGEMSWGNYGAVWTIDHIRPLSEFNLTEHEQRVKANHLSNIRPLFRSQNTNPRRLNKNVSR